MKEVSRSKLEQVFGCQRKEQRRKSENIKRSPGRRFIDQVEIRKELVMSTDWKYELKLDICEKLDLIAKGEI